MFQVDRDLNARKRHTAAPEDWLGAVNDMLITYSPNPASVIAFAKERGAIAGRWVSGTSTTAIGTDDGLVAELVDGRFVLRP